MPLPTTRRPELGAVSLPPLVLNRNEAAKALRISVRKLDYLIKDGSIMPVRLHGRVLVAWVELVNFVKGKSPRPKNSVLEPGCKDSTDERTLLSATTA